MLVKDNGKGIEKDKLKIIFKPYAQEKINTSRQYGGTGLGLAICDLIIKLMEGHIKVNSSSKGTEFTFTIPIEIVKNNNNTMVVLAWNFFKDIKKNNSNLSKNFINIKELEN